MYYTYNARIVAYINVFCEIKKLPTDLKMSLLGYYKMISHKSQKYVLNYSNY